MRPHPAVSHRRLRALIGLCIIAMLLAGIGAPAFAQQQQEPEAANGHEDQFATYNDEQQRLNEKGVRAIIAKDYALAIALLEESSAIGELNVTYLNLGRAYQKMGDCKAAREAFDKAAQAPKVARPAPALIDKKLGEYRAELDKSCTTKNQTAEAAAPTEGAEEQPDADAKSDRKSENKTAQAKNAAKETEPAQEVRPTPAPQTMTRDDSTSPWGWVLTGTGVALAGAGVGTLFWAKSLRDEVRNASVNDHGFVSSMTRADALDKQSTASTLDTVGLGMTIGGAVLTGGGIYLLLTDDTETPSRVSVQTGPDRLGVVWTGEF